MGYISIGESTNIIDKNAVVASFTQLLLYRNQRAFANARYLVISGVSGTGEIISELVIKVFNQ